ncbi:hypothetical protein FS837_006082 [Tulasnella sp. UAMH 9824]|nr:hypothetical protein FS837_006082 [Tulasnella sp. UAMH 9824]
MDNYSPPSHIELQYPSTLAQPLPPPILETTPDEENDDVYRGLVGLRPIEPLTPRVEDYFSHPHFAVPSEPSSSSSSSSSSSTSSSSSSSTSSSSTGHGRGLGALAALVERAISRWARGTSDSGSSSSSSSASTSSSSSSSSSRARSRSRSFSARRPRRRRRGASTTSVNSIQREYAPSRLAQARQLFEYSRRLPKEYTLLLPPPAIFNAPTPSAQLEPSDSRIIKTTSSKVILAHLETLLRRPPRGRAPRRPRGDKDRTARSSRVAELAGACSSGTNTPSSGSEKGKGKMRLGALQTPSDSAAPSADSPRPKLHRHNSGDTSNRTWWLDVASPSWEDTRALGKLLHLHPLTLEDIVQREQREKLEVFPGLGYYFVVFRAVEPYHPAVHDEDEAHHRSGGSDPVIAVTVYLVVFREGICSFHFEDISEHTDRVRNRILQLEKTIPWTPDWIAHGLLDSIVDGFFPIIQNIEKEVDELDSLVTGLEDMDFSDLNLPATGLLRQQPDVKPTLSPHSDSTTRATTVYDEKGERQGIGTSEPGGWKFGRAIRSCIPGARSTTQHPASEFGDEKAHFADFTKPHHIMTMHHSLVHYERILSHSHPAYLSHLRWSLSNGKGGIDRAILTLTSVTITCFTIQLCLSLMSMNVNIPHNRRPQDVPEDEDLPPGHFYVFGGVLVFVTFVVIGIVSLIRYWWKKAKRKYRRHADI